MEDFFKKTSTLFAFHLSNYAILDFNLQLVDEHREPRPDLRGIIERSAAKMPFQSYFPLLFDILFRHFRFLRKFSILPYFSSIFSHISPTFSPIFLSSQFQINRVTNPARSRSSRENSHSKEKRESHL